MQKIYKDGEVLEATDLNNSFSELETRINNINYIEIDGEKYPIAGAVPNPGGWKFSGTKPWYYAAFDIPAPYIPPPGYTFETFALESVSTTFVCTSELKRAEKRITCRVIQTWSDDITRLTLIGWRLIPTTSTI